MQKWKIIGFALLVLVVTGLAYAWQEFNRTHIDTTALRVAASKEAMALLKEFETNETLANGLYNDKIVSVKGTVQKVEDNGDTRNVILGDVSSMGGVICQFQVDHKSELDAIRPGQLINVKGVCTGILVDVVLIRCVLQ
jgi:hypothetical protein